MGVYLSNWSGGWLQYSGIEFGPCKTGRLSSGRPLDISTGALASLKGYGNQVEVVGSLFLQAVDSRVRSRDFDYLTIHIWSRSTIFNWQSLVTKYFYSHEQMKFVQ